MKSILILLAVFSFGRCYSPFHKQRTGPSRNGARDNQWINQYQAQTQDGNNRSLSGGIGTNVFDVMFQWNIMEFAYPTQQARAGKFIEN